MARSGRRAGRRGAAGGIAARPELWQAIDTLAAAALSGIGHDRLLRTGDRTERVVLTVLAERAQALQVQRDEDLAVRVANALGRVLGG